MCWEKEGKSLYDNFISQWGTECPAMLEIQGCCWIDFKGWFLLMKKFFHAKVSKDTTTIHLRHKSTCAPNCLKATHENTGPHVHHTTHNTQHNILPHHKAPQNCLHLEILLPNWSPEGEQADSHNPCIFGRILKTKSRLIFFLSAYFFKAETVTLWATWPTLDGLLR